jgi:hypothetical protein
MELQYKFDKIKTEEQAYWFGYLMADGYNHKSGTVLQFTQAEQDKEMVYKLKDFFGGGGICITKFDEDDPRQNLYMLSVYNSILCSNLTKLGCHNNKSLNMTMPKISKPLFWHFIRGYFDGDGCLYSKIRNSDNSIIIECPIVCSNDFAESFKEILKDNGIIPYCQKLGKNKLCTTIKITGVLKNSKFLSLLYKDATIYSPRKMNKFMEFCKILDSYETTHKKTKEAKLILQQNGFIPL